MELLRPRHLVFVRHGESEGDIRRQAGAQALKHPKNEEQTERGHRQSRAAGIWIAGYVLAAYGFDQFDRYLTSPLIRTKQSAKSCGLSDNWQDEPRLSERDRGAIQGMTRQKHQQLFPKSYQQMLDYPFHWTPPDGESLLKVSARLTGMLLELNKNYHTALIMTHRDVMWAAHMSIDGLDLDEIERVDTDQISNGYIMHYTNVSPHDGSIDENLRWKRSADPCLSQGSASPSSDWADLRTALV